MYVRFTTLRRDAESHSLTGVFQAALELFSSEKLARHEEVEMTESLAWLKTHLKSPDCLREPGNHRAICWFKPRATRPMRQVWRIVNVLKEHGVQVEVHKTTDPGIVLYEDGWQVVAKPKKKS